MADQELQVVEGVFFFFFFFFFMHRIYNMYKTGAGFIGSLEFVGLPPRGPNDTAQNLPKPNPSDRTG